MKQKLRENNKLITEYRKRFYNIYHTKVAPIFAKFERERKKKLYELICCELVIFAILIICIFAYAQLFIIPLLLTIVAIFLSFFIAYIFNYNFIKNLKNNCKSKVVEAFDNIRWYNSYRMFSDNEVKKSQLFAYYNKRFSYDAFQGVYKDVPFQIEETYMYYKSGKYFNEIFRGVIIKFKSNKNIKNTTIIATKNDKNIKNNRLNGLFLFIAICQIFFAIRDNDITTIIIFLICGICVLATMLYFYKLNKDIDKGMEFLKKKIKDPELKVLYTNKDRNNEVLEEMKLEDPKFNKRYKAYSSDQIEGRYLITPAFIERFNNLQTAFGTNRAKCSFYDDEIMFAISSNKDLFEIGNIFHSLNDSKHMITFFNELSSILALVDYFKLDEKTGL